MTLYNLRSDGTITKWDPDGNIQAQYTVSEDGCTCPAGHRTSCRHRQMLPYLLPYADTHWFWNFDRHTAVDFQGTPKAMVDRLTEVLAALPAEPTEDTILEGEIIPLGEINASGIYAKDITPAKPANWRRI